LSKNTLILLLLCCFSILSYSQVETIRFKNYSFQQGLSNNWVNSIAEDDQGLIWIATRAGLNIYDGTNNTLLKHEASDSNSLSSNDVSDIIYSKHGYIVAGTWGTGINLIKTKSKEILKIPELEKYNQLVVKSIAEDSDSNLWIGSYGEGLYHLDLKTYEVTKCSFAAEDEEHQNLFNYLQDICFLNDTLWMSSRQGGLGYVTKGSHSITEVKYNKGLKIGDITFFFHDGSKLILGTQEGKVFFSDSKKESFYQPFNLQKDASHQNRINAISKTKNNELWISASSGIYKYNTDNKQLTSIISPTPGEEYNDNFCSFFDSRGILWSGTWGNGINWYSPKSIPFKDILKMTAPFYLELLVALLLMILRINLQKN